MRSNDKFAAVPKKYEGINFKPPASVAEQAEKGLEYRRLSGKGGLSSQEAGKSGIGSGVQRAVNLKNRNNIAPDTIQQMLNFFSRHEHNKSIAPENRDTPEEDAGYVAWLLWGGDAGKDWAEGVKEKMLEADEKEKKKKEEEKKKKAHVKRGFTSEVDPTQAPVPPGGIKTLPNNRWVLVHWDEMSESMRGSIWDVYDLTYGQIGKHVPDISTFAKKYKILYLIDVDEDIAPDAFIAYKSTPAGNKITLGGTDGTSLAKRAMIRKMKELIQLPGWYAEASHKIADIIESTGLKPIDDEEVVRKTLGGKDLQWLGGGKYVRQLGDSNIAAAKSLYGTPKTASSPLRMRRDYGSVLAQDWGPLLQETKTASETGDGSEAGIFIPLPEELAKQFPPLSQDSSKPHVTFLYVGNIVGKEEIFEKAVRDFFAEERGPILARLSGVDYFTNQTSRVAYTRVHFSTDMGAMRDRLASKLEDLGFTVENRFPLAYLPHVTLEYMSDPNGRWEGPVPVGEWHFHSVEVWGVPNLVEVSFGPKDPPSTTLLRIQRKREASRKLFFDWFGV